MPLHPIFHQPEPRAFGSEDHTFRVRLGSMTAEGKPMSHDTLRFTTGDPVVADELASLYGGTPNEWPTKTEEVLEVLSTVPSVEVIFESIKPEMILWPRHGKQPVRSCDGQVQNDGKKTPCVCAVQYPEKAANKQASKDGQACQPTVKASFRLLDAPHLGLGRFQSTAWSLYEGDPPWKIDYLGDDERFQPPIGQIVEQLEEHGGRAVGTLETMQVRYKSKVHGPVAYSKPFFTINGPAPAEALVAG